MKTKIMILFALVLCMGAFFMPVSAYAASDTTPPKVLAWITGEVLRIEASDADSGVEAVFINGTRFNYRVDGVLDVSARDNAGTGKQISVYAVDFAGNKSDTILITNPYYVAPTSTPAATQKPATTPSTATTEPEVTPTPDITYEPVPSTPETSGGQAFTPAGTGTVIDDIDEKNGKEFFSITTADGNVFYLIVDRYKDSENVYLLNAVTEGDLMALAEKSDGGGSSQSAVPTPAPTETPTPAETEDPAEETPKDSGGSNGMMIFLVIVVIAVGGAGYYFKIMKPKQDAVNAGNDEDDTEYEDGDRDYEYEDEAEESGENDGGDAADEDYSGGDDDGDYETEDE